MIPQPNHGLKLRLKCFPLRSRFSLTQVTLADFFLTSLADSTPEVKATLHFKTKISLFLGLNIVGNTLNNFKYTTQQNIKQMFLFQTL